GILTEAFKDGFNFDSYANLIWRLPLMFASDKKGEFKEANGKTLHDLSRGTMPGVDADDANQLHAIRELFTEARLKPGYVEVRSIDGQIPQIRYAAVAFWMGLLYNPAGREFLLREFSCLPLSERHNLLLTAMKDGLDGKWGKCSLYSVAQTAVQ